MAKGDVMDTGRLRSGMLLCVAALAAWVLVLAAPVFSWADEPDGLASSASTEVDEVADVAADDGASKPDKEAVAVEDGATEGDGIDVQTEEPATQGTDIAGQVVASTTEPDSLEGASDAQVADQAPEQDEPAAVLEEASGADEQLEDDFVEPSQADASKFVRLWGNTALDTMARIVQQGFSSSRYAILATNAGYWDALAASGLAGIYQCPIILTDPSNLSSQARTEIARLNVQKVFIVGGTAAVLSRIEQQVKAMNCSVERLAGRTAEFTAIAIYEHGKGRWGNDKFLTTVKGYWDALSIAPYAYARKAPIFLYDPPTQTHWHSGSTHRALSGGRVILLGGTSAIPAYIHDYHGVGDLRLAGDDAYQTSLVVAKWCVEQGMKGTACGVATGNGYWDALSAGPLCGKANIPIVLAADAFPVCVDKFIKERGIKQGYIFGGPAAISNPLESKILGAPANPSVVDCKGGDVSLTGTIVRKVVPAGDHPSGYPYVVYILEFDNAVKLKNDLMKRTSATRAYVQSELATNGNASNLTIQPWQSYVGKKVTIRGKLRFEQGTPNGGTLLHLLGDAGNNYVAKVVGVWN